MSSENSFAAPFRDGALVGNLISFLPSQLMGSLAQLLRQPNHQKLVQTDGFVRFIESVRG